MQMIQMTLFFVFMMSAACSLVSITPALRSSDGSERFTISFQTPNISISNNKLYLCVAARLPDGLEDSFIAKVHALPDASAFCHISVVTCDEPGFGSQHLKGSGDEVVVWDCGSLYSSGSIPPLDRGSECAAGTRGAHSNFVTQWQSGSADEDTLELPDGMGIRVRGRNNRPKYLLSAFHYPSVGLTDHATTGVNGVDVTLLANSPHIQQADTLIINAIGFSDGNSNQVITGSWTLDQEIPIQPILLYTHWHHDINTDIQVWIERTTGEKDWIMRQDPHTFWGVSRVDDSSSAIIHPGDKITLSCTFNNTTPDVVVVIEKEMCVLNMAYAVRGNKMLDTAVVYSADPRFYDCFAEAIGQTPGIVFNGEGHNDYSSSIRSSAETCLLFQ